MKQAFVSVQFTVIAHPRNAPLMALLLIMLFFSVPVQANSPSGGPSWSIYNHTCPGASRTDALHRDADGTLWVGCGSTASGYGLFTSQDGGQNWLTVSTTDDLLFQFRVLSISRGHDGALYVAGGTQNNTNMVLRLDTSATMPYPASVTLVGSFSQVGRSFNVGNYAELSDGRALATSSVGAPQLYRPNAGTGSSALDWTIPPNAIYQFLDMTVRNDQFIGVGHNIAQPPRVFLPSQTPGAQAYDFTVVQLSNSWLGELWGVAANQQRIVAVGVNQIANIGMIFVSQGNPYSAANYISHELPDIVGTGGAGTWARGACMHDDLIVVVGERQPLGSASGLVMASNDGGQSFFNITPSPSAETMSRCVITPEGLVIVAGAAGFLGIWNGFLPSDLIFRSRFE